MHEQVRALRRPAADGVPAFDLRYVRSGPRTSTPALIIPGGPGLASVLPYRGLRRRAAAGGLDVLMVEHRGVGRSRRDEAGHVLPPAAMRITAVLDDFAAVLDAESVDRAYVVGSSYGPTRSRTAVRRAADPSRGTVCSGRRCQASVEIPRTGRIEG